MYKVIKRLYSGRYLIGFEVIDLTTNKSVRLQTVTLIEAIQSGNVTNAIFKNDKVVVRDTNLEKVNIRRNFHTILPIKSKCKATIRLCRLFRSEINGKLYFSIDMKCDSKLGYNEVATAIKMYSENDETAKYRIIDLHDNLLAEMNVMDLMAYGMANRDKLQVYMKKSDVNDLMNEELVIKCINTVGIKFV